MKIGIIGERHNFMSQTMLKESLACRGVEVVWFLEAGIPVGKQEKLYGRKFDYGPILNTIKRSKGILKINNHNGAIDCCKVCNKEGIAYIVPQGLSLNDGLPEEMYRQPQVDYALIAGCDQILKEKALRIARKKIINYHYSPLPAYRGKYIAFWQWYNREPFIGYTFHEVDLGVDTGKIIYQGKVDYDPAEMYDTVIRRVVTESGKQLNEVYDCLEQSRQVLLAGEREESLFKSRDYLNLVTAGRSQQVEQMQEVFERTGWFRLKNGLVISQIIDYGQGKTDNYQVDSEGVVIPLADGYIKGRVISPVPFWLFKLLVGKKRLLAGLN